MGGHSLHQVYVADGLLSRKLALLALCRVQHFDSFGAADDGLFGHAEEEASFDDTDDTFHACMDSERVGDALGEGAIDDHVAVIGNINLVAEFAHLYGDTQGL